MQPQVTARCKFKGQIIAQKVDYKIMYIQHAHGLCYSSPCNLYCTDEAQCDMCNVSVGVKRLITSICYINVVCDGRRLIHEK